MANDIARRDENHVTTLLGVTDNVAREIRELLVDPITGRLLVSGTFANVITSLNGQTGTTQTFSDTDDTNVTLTITSALNDHNFAIGWTGDLSVARGGTGVNTFTPYSVICSGTTATGDLQEVIPGTAGQVLTSNGAGLLPTWQAGGGGGSGEREEFSVNQTTHGFSVGNVVRSAEIDGEYTLAQANSVINAEVVGIVTAVADVDNFTLTISGKISVPSAVPVSNAGDVLFLSPSVAGGLTTTIPNTIGQVVKPLAIVTIGGDEMIWLNFRGNEVSNTSGNTGGGFYWNDVTSTTQTLVAGNAYITNNISQVVLTLPISANVGDRFMIVGKGAGGWKLEQNAGQTIYFLSNNTTTGITGYLESTQNRNCVELVCTASNSEFTVCNSMGNITII